MGELVDASPALWSLRAIKSPAEAERVRTACAITSAAYAAVFPTLRAGMTERDVAARLRQAMAERGAHSSWVWVVSGPGEFDRIDGVTRASSTAVTSCSSTWERVSAATGPISHAPR